jgi:elongation factor P--beta-lysine ligase
MLEWYHTGWSYIELMAECEEMVRSIAGQAAGSRTIGVLTGFDDQAMLATEHPDAIIENLGKLTDVIAF